MRLIDADVVVKDIADLMRSPWFCAKEGFPWRKEAVEIVRDLCVIKEPTVEAIPIEWIKERIEDLNEYISKWGGVFEQEHVVDAKIHEVGGLIRLIADWRAERKEE